MGIDGHNTLHIRGPQTDLDEIMSTKAVLTSDTNEMFNTVSRYYFGDNAKISHSSERYLVIDYPARNGIFYDYLKRLLELHPKCWFKNEYSDENGHAIVWTARYVNGQIQSEEAEWSEPTIEELVHLEDYSIVTEN